MPLVSDRCICLRKVDYSETSQILSLFSREHGALRAIAKGAHRRTKAGASKFDGGLDLLDVGDAVFTHDPSRDLATLTEWGLREGHLELRRSLRGIYLGLYAAELVGRLIEEHDPHPGLFDRLEATLADLATPRREEAFLAFQLDLLRESGYLAELFACASCGAVVAPDDRAGAAGGAGAAAFFFSPHRGGVVCRGCEGATPDRESFDPRLLRLVQGVIRMTRANGSAVAGTGPDGGNVAARRLPMLTRHQTDPINRMLAGHVQHTLGRRLQLAPYVLSNTPGRGG